MTAASTTSEAEVDKRESRIFHEEDPGLIWDLRTENNGRLLEYKEFLQNYQQEINTSVDTAVGDRRHDVVAVNDDVVTHFASASSVRYLHEQVIHSMPRRNRHTQHPVLQIHFWPRKPTARVATQVKFMVQARQLMKNHVDAD